MLKTNYPIVKILYVFFQRNLNLLLNSILPYLLGFENKNFVEKFNLSTNSNIKVI